jgi:NADP-dependent 3-hydroxy acid dehydrogenase YdfG
VLGKVIAARFAPPGYSAAAPARAQAPVANQPAGSGATLWIKAVDSTDSAATQEAMDAIIDKFGALDTLREPA